MPRIRVTLLVLAGLVWVGCDGTHPSDPAVPAASTAVGPTVKPPSNSTAVAVSESRIDVSWQDNSDNETGFKLHRSSTGPSGSFLLLASVGANTTNYVDAGLSASTEYCYKVRAFRNQGGKTSYSGFASTTCATTPAPPPPPGPPNAPSDTKATPEPSLDVRLTWSDNSGNETGFRLERSATSTGPWAVFGTTPPDVHQAFESGRTFEEQVCYRVRAFNNQGDSPPSNAACTAPPAIPSNLTATAAGPQAIDLVWADNSAVEDGYEVQRLATVDQGSSVVASVSANVTGFRDTGLSTNTTYWYRVRAKKDGGFSAFSYPASATAASAPPDAPWATNARPTSGSTMNLTWGDTTSNEDGFRVERSADGGVSWSVVGTITPNVWHYYSFGDSGPLTSEQLVCYRVIAFNSAGDSPASNVDCTTPPAEPGNLTVTVVDETTVDLTWTDNSGVEDLYVVCRIYTYQESWFAIAYLAANSTSYRVSQPFAGVQYWYAVLAHKDDGPTCDDLSL